MIKLGTLSSHAEPPLVLSYLDAHGVWLGDALPSCCGVCLGRGQCYTIGSIQRHHRPMASSPIRVTL